MGTSNPWTPKQLRAAVEILASHSTMRAAGGDPKFEKRTGHRFPGITNLADRFRSANMKHPREYLRLRDPVTRAIEADKQTRLRSEHADLVEQLREAKAREKLLALVGEECRPLIVKPFAAGRKRAATAVALASDWHVEETVQAVSVANRNRYDLKIAASSVERFFAGIRWLITFHREAFDIRALVLSLLGDLMTGYIHEELAESNELAPVETVLWLRDRIIAGINFLLEDPRLDQLVIPCSYGNHGRTTRKPRRATGAVNSYEWLLYQIIAQQITDKRVSFVADRSAHQYVQAHGRTLHFHHGDEVRYLGGVGGLAVPLKRRIPAWDNVKRADYHHVGHFHQFLDLGHTLVNGSLIGYNAYAMSIGAEFEEPRQAFYLLDAKRGKTCVSPSWVRE